MAFPITPVLDTFNRANEGPPMTGWTDLLNGLRVVSNQCVGSNAAGNISYFTGAPAGPNAELFATIITKPSDGSSVVMIHVSPALNGYGAALFADAAVDVVGVVRYDAGVGTLLASAGQEMTSGDKLGYERVGNLHRVWACISGVWSPFAAALDATYTAAAQLGILTADATTTLEDFGGGTTLPVEWVTPVYRMGERTAARMIPSGFVPPGTG